MFGIIPSFVREEVRVDFSRRCLGKIFVVSGQNRSKPERIFDVGGGLPIFLSSGLPISPSSVALLFSPAVRFPISPCLRRQVRWALVFSSRLRSAAPWDELVFKFIPVIFENIKVNIILPDLRRNGDQFGLHKRNPMFIPPLKLKGFTKWCYTGKCRCETKNCWVSVSWSQLELERGCVTTLSQVK